jgi:lactoylglutathione lyase
VQSLSYIVLRCADLERSRQFYEALGLRLSVEQHGTGSRHYSCDVGGIVLELYPLAGKATSGARVGLVVSDLDRVIQAVRSFGAEVATGSSGSAMVVDPDGHQIALEMKRPAG